MSACGEFSDYDLVALMKQGDHDAYSEIYHRYFKLLFRHAFARLRNEDEAKDIVQELFTNLWYKRESLTPERNISHYLYTSVRNRIFDLISRKDMESKYLDTLPQTVEYSANITDYRVRENFLKQIIDREIAALPPKMREVFLLSRNEHLPHNEIASRLNLSEQSVRSHVKNALKVLRKKLGLILCFFF